MTEHRKPSACHSTAQEIEFITNLGRRVHSGIDIPRPRLLAQYRAAIVARGAWGNVNPAAILGECDRQIALEEKRAR